jgi:hypothetical protein
MHKAVKLVSIQQLRALTALPNGFGQYGMMALVIPEDFWHPNGLAVVMR